MVGLQQCLLLPVQLFVLAPRQCSLAATAPLSLGQVVLAAGVGVSSRLVLALVLGVVAVAECGRVD